jgi:ABC-type nitrate/sulfonate/bicarbonate transport system ATPase subunit
MIDLNSVSFAYPGGRPIFSDFSWRVERGETWAVLGPSGFGKSTLLYLLAGLRTPTSGEVCIEGQVVRRPRPRTGLILQDFGLLPWATCEQNVSLGLRIHGYYGPDGKHAPAGLPPASVRERTEHWLARLGLSSVRRQYPSQLSGGQRQRTAIARTLALEPDLLLMDEPFASLDAPTREGLQNLTLELQAEQHLTTVVVTHSIEEAAFLGGHILLFGQGIETIPNPGAGTAAYRGSQEYYELCDRLRARMGAGAAAAEAAAAAESAVRSPVGARLA